MKELAEDLYRENRDFWEVRNRIMIKLKYGSEVDGDEIDTIDEQLDKISDLMNEVAEKLEKF